MPTSYSWPLIPPAPSPAAPTSAPVVPVTDTSPYGIDCRLTFDATTNTWDFDPYFTLLTGPSVLTQAAGLRLTTPRGGLFYDPNYGSDQRGNVNGAYSASDLSRLQMSIVAELEKDERVGSAAVQVTQNQSLSELFESIQIAPATGPYAHTMPATSVTSDDLTFTS